MGRLGSSSAEAITAETTEIDGGCLTCDAPQTESVGIKYESGSVGRHKNSNKEIQEDGRRQTSSRHETETQPYLLLQRATVVS